MKKNIVFIFLVGMIAACNNQRQQQSEGKAKKKKTHAELMTFFPKPKVKIKTVGILIYDGYFTLDAIGPYAVLSEMMGSQVFLIGRHKGLISSVNGMKIQTDTSMEKVEQLDVLVIPGGFQQTYEATQDTALLNWIRRIDGQSIYTTSVCTGAWILGAAGLLKDRKATTHWYGKQLLKDKFGAIISNDRYTRDGKYWTSAGVTAGMDLSLALINEIMGEKYTKAVMLDLEYNPAPPFKGGSVRNTDKEVVDMMRAMYDGGMEKLLNPD